MELKFRVNSAWFMVASLIFVFLTGTASQTPTCTRRNDIVFVVDQSSSVVASNPLNGSWDNWVLVKNFINTIIDNSAVSSSGTHFGMVTYNNYAQTRFYLTSYSYASDLTYTVNNISPGQGQSDLYSGLNMARTQVLSPDYGARPDVPQTIIVITDGVPDLNSALMLPEAAACNAAGINVFVVGVTSKVNETQLMLVSSPPRVKNENYWTVGDFTELQGIAGNVLQASCSPPKPATAACRTIDLIFAVDIPQAQSDFTILKNFINQFVTLYLPIAPSAVQVGLAIYDSMRATPQFQLNTFSNEDDVKTAVGAIPFAPSAQPADPLYALQYINASMFTTSNGARGPNNQKVIVVITDNALPNPAGVTRALAAYRAQGVRVFAVGATDNVGLADLTSLATSSNDVMSSVSYVYLTPKVQLMSSLLCNPGSSYAVVCPAIADIILIMDQSTSIVSAQGGYNNWNTYMLGFAQSLAASFPISPSLTQLGVIKFSYSATPAFSLNAFTDQKNLTNAIKNLQLNGGETDIADALRKTRTIMFSPGNGARAGVPHLAILITDGQANIEADQTQIEANLTKAAGIEIFAIGMTNNVNVQQLQQIASSPTATHYYYVSDYSKLNLILNDLVSKACLSLPAIQTTAPPQLTNDMGQSTTMSPTTTSPTTTTSTTTSPTTTTSTTTSPTTTTSTTTTSTTTSPTTTASTTTTSTTTSPTTTTPTTTTSTAAIPTTMIIPITTLPTTSSTASTSTATTSLTTTPTTTQPTTVPSSTLSTTGLAKPTPAFQTTISSIAPAPSTPALAGGVTTTRASMTPSPTGPTGGAGLSTRNYNTIEEQAGCRKMSDVVFVIDRTTNLNYNYFKSYVIVQFIDVIVAQLDIDAARAQVGVVTFSETATVEFYLGNYSRTVDVVSALSKVSYGGLVANLSAAISLTRTQLFSQANGARKGIGVSWVAIIITDNPSADQTATLYEASLARKAGIALVSVGVGTYLNAYELSALATFPPEANSFSVSTVKNIASIEDPVKRIICADDGSCKSASCASSCVELANSVQCSCPAGTAGALCDKTCSHGGDIVFALSTSNKFGLPFVQAMTVFMSTLITSFDTTSSPDGPTVSRIGLVTYGTVATVQFDLSTFVGDPADMMQAINVPATSGADNLALAINVARTRMFTAANGDRPASPNYLVIMMNGQSDNATSSWSEAVAARAAGISVIVVSLSTSANLVELNGLASAPVTSNVYYGWNTSALTDGWRSQIANSICANIDYCAGAPCKGGAVCSNTLAGYSCGPCPLAPPSTGLNCERACSGVIDLVFVLGDAGTVHLERWPLVLQFVINVVQNLDVSPTRTQVGLVYYSDDAYVGFTLNQFTTRQDVIAAISRTPYIGNRTNTASALRLLRRTIFQQTNGDRQNAANIAVLVANGESTVDQTLTISEAVENRIGGAVLMTVGVGPQMVNSLELQGIASFARNRTMMYAASFDELPGVYGVVVAAICQNVNYCSPNPCQNGGTCQSVIGQYICSCPMGISGVSCERTCNVSMDLVLILDNSGSVQQEYQQSVSFARLVVSGLDINSGLVRVGAIAFSSQIVGQFFLNQNLNSAQAVYNSLDFFNQFNTTNTPAALEAAYSQQFTATNGDRPSVQNYVVIVTDGNSNVNQNRTIPDAVLLKNNGVVIYSIAVGVNSQLSELVGMASSPSTKYIIALPSIGDISKAASNLLNSLCSGS